MTTPTTPQGLRQYDHLPAAEAAVRAWTEPGGFPGWHQTTQRRVHRDMPLLGRALDRLAAETEDANIWPTSEWADKIFYRED
ncbi:MAG: hypothetical protein GEU78_15050 [Actinobacteria bacterium]|nr:hypothetical protein [Actinomycetota bacterium]